MTTLPPHMDISDQCTFCQMRNISHFSGGRLLRVLHWMKLSRFWYAPPIAHGTCHFRFWYMALIPNLNLVLCLWDMLIKCVFSSRQLICRRGRHAYMDVACNRSLDRWIGQWCSYNFAAGSFHTNKLCSRLFSREIEFYWHKQRYRVFVSPFGGLRGNVHGSSMARWKVAWSTSYKC